MMPFVKRTFTIAVAALAAAALAVTATAASGRHAGDTFTYCSDITYPPEEFYQGTKPAGSDIDIGTEVAKRMGKTAKFDNTGFGADAAAPANGATKEGCPAAGGAWCGRTGPGCPGSAPARSRAPRRG